MGRIGYIRVSTEHQETARQEALMKQYKVERVFAEKISGKKALCNTQGQNFYMYISIWGEGASCYFASFLS